MTRHRLYSFEPHTVRNTLNDAVQTADKIHDLEKSLVDKLVEIDRHRYFVRFGYNSLRGFCVNGLRFTKNRAQGLVTKVRQIRNTEETMLPTPSASIPGESTTTLPDEGQLRAKTRQLSEEACDTGLRLDGIRSANGRTK